MNKFDSAVITSAKNPHIKHLRRLATQAKYRRVHARTLLDGVHLCQSYLDTGNQPETVVVSETARTNTEVIQLLTRIHGSVSVSVVSDAIVSSMSPVEHGVGVLFVVPIPDPRTVPELTADALLLDDVQDPGNVGTLLRSAAAAGVSRVYISKDTASVWAPKVLRAGMGAQFVLELYEQVELIDLVKTARVPVYATSLAAQRTIYEAELQSPIAWIFGSEGRGVSDDLLACASHTVIIPQVTSVESLNVAAAAAVCLFEQRRQRMVH